MPKLEDWEEIGNALLKPFPEREIEFKPGTSWQGKALALAHIDARAVMRRLDQTVGPECWCFDYDPVVTEPAKCMVKGRLTVRGITKADAGEADGTGELLKSAVSDAIKRAAVMFGVGRFLYELPPLWVPHDGKRFTQTPHLEPQQIVDAAVKAGWQGDEEALTLELQMDAEAHQGHAPAAQAPVRFASGMPEAPTQDTGEYQEQEGRAFTCQWPDCGKALTEQQRNTSRRAFGNCEYCPAHQREAAQAGQAAQERQERAAPAPQQQQGSVQAVCAWPGCGEPLSEKVVAFCQSKKGGRLLCFDHQQADRAGGQTQRPRNTPANRPV